MKKYFVQNIGYDINPYYSSVNVQSPFTDSDNIQIYKLINAIDTVIDFVTIGNCSEGIRKFHTNADSYVKQLRCLVDERSKSDVELNKTLLTILDEAINLVERYIVNCTTNENFNIQKSSTVSGEKDLTKQIAKLEKQGFLELEFPQTSEFLAWSDDQMKSAKLKYENEADWRGANAYSPSDPGYRLIETFIKDNHILEIISAYKKMDMSFYYAAWDYSHNRQKWFRNNHEYGHISPTNYYHFDADEDVAKMLIYLTDVSKGDGPFKVVTGSNNMAKSTFQVYLYYAIDSKISPQFLKIDNMYGRGLFLYRKDLFLKFPEAFMGTTHFGDDLIEGSELSEYLLKNTVTFERKKGAVVLFDGYRGIHAGGNANTGERLAIQVAFRRTKSFNSPKSITEKAKQYLKSYLGK